NRWPSAMYDSPMCGMLCVPRWPSGRCSVDMGGFLIQRWMSIGRVDSGHAWVQAAKTTDSRLVTPLLLDRSWWSGGTVIWWHSGLVAQRIWPPTRGVTSRLIATGVARVVGPAPGAGAGLVCRSQVVVSEMDPIHHKRPLQIAGLLLNSSSRSRRRGPARH